MQLQTNHLLLRPFLQCTGFLNTPPIWEKKAFDIQQFDFPNLDLHSFQPKHIPNKLRLGHQIEYVFKQLVQYSDTYEVILHNLPVREAGKTLGEIDFILKNKADGQFIHVELTYKFYIINPEVAEPKHQLIGPNLRDMFFTKMEKIKNHQFPLLHTAAGAKALEDNNINHLDLEHQCCFKAQLFHPYGNSAVDIGRLNRACLAGYWLRFETFNQAEFAAAQFYMPTKSEWVIEPHLHVIWKSHVDIMLAIQERLQKERAPLIWVKRVDMEFEKVFVVWW